jgi:hypothetical protein
MYDITVFGAEPHGNYNRILLSPVLAAEKTVDDIMLNDERLVRRARHPAAQGPQGRAHRPRPPRGGRGGRHRGPTTGCCWRPDRTRS